MQTEDLSLHLSDEAALLTRGEMDRYARAPITTFAVVTA
jgi:hypothetical protein